MTPQEAANPAAEALSEDIPRLFMFRSGGVLGPQTADGVQWPDGAISVRRFDPPVTESWTGWEDPAAIEVHDGTTAVVWRRQDIYSDAEGTDT